MTDKIFDMAQLIDHTNLSPFASSEDIKKLCQEAVKYNFKMVAINQYYTKYAKSLLKDTNVNVGAAISFPLGQTTIESKVFETQNAVECGADEIDYVVNISKVKEGDFEYIEREMQSIYEVTKPHDIILKAIFEVCYLTDSEIVSICDIAKKVGIDFVKTSTGFGPCGATYESVKLMSESVENKVYLKAAGGIRDLKTFNEMVRLGARRIGTSSGISILEELEAQY